MLKQTKYLTLIAILLICGLALLLPFNTIKTKVNIEDLNDTSIVNLRLNNTGNVLTVEIAKSERKLEEGFMFRQNIPSNTGMLFIFQNLGNLTFWMKNTPSSLDIIFLDQDFKVINFYRHTLPDQTSELYPSKAPAQYVLETNAGWSMQTSLKEGDQFTLEAK